MVTAITMGDAAGVGPELILRAHEQSLFSGPTVVIGDYSVLERCQKAIGTSCDLQRLSPEAAIGEAAEHTGAEAAEHAGYEGEKPAGAPIDAGGKEPPPRPLLVYDLGLLTGEEVPVGKVSAKTGEAAARYVEHATRLALAGHIDGFVTCPMNKEATRLALPEFTGHTELIAELCGAENVSMMLASKRLIVSHVSTHVSLAEAISKVSRDRVLSVIRLTHEALSRLSSTSRLAV
ncbi:MAG: 4-hydroxythreonine-4-phosphate dehydrogenase PdxA, partial [Spirochaetota bacterium]